MAKSTADKIAVTSEFREIVDYLFVHGLTSKYVLVKVSGHSLEDINEMIDALKEAEVVRERGSHFELELTFRHMFANKHKLIRLIERYKAKQRHYGRKIQATEKELDSIDVKIIEGKKYNKRKKEILNINHAVEEIRLDKLNNIVDELERVKYEGRSDTSG